MGTIDDNKHFYDNYDWQHGGEEWASRWGGSDVQWYGTILSRIHTFLPAPTILEIGAGHGRLSRYLAGYCERLILVDMTEACVASCRRRFADDPKVVCLRTDGRSLAGLEASSVDFAFSFFSLVHADDATLGAYLEAIARTLSRDGVAFLHHSNAASCASDDPDDNEVLHDYRDITVSAAAIGRRAETVGLRCRSQELFGWDTARVLTDCFSVLTRPDSRFAKANTVICNWDFPFEVEKLNQLADAYGTVSHVS